MVPDGCLAQVFIDSAGATNLEGRCFVTFGGLPPERLEGKGGEFVVRYKKRYGEEPEAYAVYGYEAACVALHAIATAGSKDRRAITDAALAIRDFNGAFVFEEVLDEADILPGPAPSSPAPAADAAPAPTLP
jgi:branched-chain amino acid transport system substrate-binding protein